MPIFNLRDCKVIEVVEEAKDIRTLKCRVTDDKPFTHKPGQFVMIYLPEKIDTPKDGRAYSIPSSPTKPFDVTYKLAGAFTHLLNNVKAGDALKFTGPFGFFTLNEKAKHQVMIAGGIGITPFMSYLRYAEEKKPETRLTLLYSNRTVEDIAFRKELEDMQAKGVANIVFTVTRPHESKTPWNGHSVRINHQLIQANVSDLGEAEFCLCGSPDFVKGVQETLHAMGVPKERIREEKF